jgi:hypothetical protein
VERIRLGLAYFVARLLESIIAFQLYRSLTGCEKEELPKETELKLRERDIASGR